MRLTRIDALGYEMPAPLVAWSRAGTKYTLCVDDDDGTLFVEEQYACACS